jgi:flagellar motor switch/type III secretory pathway protein FliN
VLSESIVQPENTSATNVSVVLGSTVLDPQTISELSQPGACIRSQIEASNKVSLMVQDNEIACGTLAEMGGRWAVVVD